MRNGWRVDCACYHVCVQLCQRLQLKWEFCLRHAKMKMRSVACVTIDCAIHTLSSTSHCSPTAKTQKKTAATLACKYGGWIKIVLYQHEQRGCMHKGYMPIS